VKRFAALSFVVLLVPAMALGADDRAAEALIARGLELRREDKPAEALEMFRRAHALAPSGRTLGQMGLAETAVDQWTEAEGHLTGSLAKADDGWVRKNHALLDQALTMARGHIGELAFTGPAGAAVTVAGRNIGNLPSLAPVRLGEGTVLVTASAPGFKQFIASVTVLAGKQVPVAITLDPIDVRAVADPEAAQALTSPAMVELRPHYSWRAWAGGALVGAGVGILAWGIAWVALDGRGAGGTCAASITAPCEPVYNTRTPGWILTGAGAAIALGGGALLYTARSSGGDVTLGFGPTSFRLGGRF
jgi:PEGA domain-containing protein